MAAITFPDNILVNIPKPLDMKAYVGSDLRFEYDTPADIPQSFRFVGMRVVYVDENKEYVLTNNNSSTGSWEEVASGSGSMTLFRDSYLVSASETNYKKFELNSDGWQVDNSIVTVNGVEIPPSDYRFIKASQDPDKPDDDTQPTMFAINPDSIQFDSYELEPNDLIIIKKYY